MKAIAQVTLVLALSLGLLAGIVYGLGDRTIWVAPPETVAEGFMRQLETERYPGAATYLSKNLSESIGTAELRAMLEALRHETRAIFDVNGKRGVIDGDSAEANVELSTEHAGTRSFSFSLVWEKGAWKIDDLGSLAEGSSGS